MDKMFQFLFTSVRVCCVHVCVCMGDGVGMCFWLMFVMITEVFCGTDLLQGVGEE